MRRFFLILALIFGGFGPMMANDIPDLSNLLIDEAQNTNTALDNQAAKPQESSTPSNLQIPSIETSNNNQKPQESEEMLIDLNALLPIIDNKDSSKKEDAPQAPKQNAIKAPQEQEEIIKLDLGETKQGGDIEKDIQKAKEQKVDRDANPPSTTLNLEPIQKDEKSNIQNIKDFSDISNMKEAPNLPADIPALDSQPSPQAAPMPNLPADIPALPKPKEDISDDDESYLYDENTPPKVDKNIVNEGGKSTESKEVNNNIPKNKPMSGPKVQLEENTASSRSDVNKEVSFVQEDFYELDDDDFEFQSKEGEKKEYLLRVVSLDLEAFVNGQSYDEKNQVQTFGVNNNFTQILSKDGKIQEYKFYQKGAKKNTILNTMRMPLEKIDFDTFRIVARALPHFFDATACKVIIRKELKATLNQNKEVIMDLDIKRELKNTTNFKLFLECPR